MIPDAGGEGCAGIERGLRDPERDLPHPAGDVSPPAWMAGHRPDACMRWIQAVPGSFGPAVVPITPWPIIAWTSRSSET